MAKGLFEIEHQMSTAKAYKQICRQEMQKLSAKNHAFDFDHHFYQNKIQEYDDIIAHLEGKRKTYVQRKLYGYLTAVHATTIFLFIILLRYWL